MVVKTQTIVISAQLDQICDVACKFGNVMLKEQKKGDIFGNMCIYLAIPSPTQDVFTSGDTRRDLKMICVIDLADYYLDNKPKYRLLLQMSLAPFQAIGQRDTYENRKTLTRASYLGIQVCKKKYFGSAPPGNNSISN